MWRREVASGASIPVVAQSCLHMPVPIEHREMPRLACGNLPAPTRSRPSVPRQFRHIDRSIGREEDLARPLDLFPDIEHLAVGRKDLDAVVLAIAHEHPTI